MKASIIKATALAAALWACGYDAAAMTYIMPEDRTLLAGSDGVFVGTVVAEPVAAPSRGLPHLRYKLVVDRVLAGDLRRAEVHLDLPGTPKNAKLRAFIPGMPELQAGQRVLVFFVDRADGVVVPRDFSLGVFFEQRDGLGQTSYVRRLDGAHAMGKGAMPAGDRDAARFERWIRRTSAGVESNPDYFVAGNTKFMVAPTGFPDGLPARWFDFDTNTTINWRAITTGMTGATFDEFAAVSSALAAWTNDPGSRILYSYAGTVASDNGNDLPTNGVNAVIWDDPNSDISGSYNCAGGGTLAIGGAFASSLTGTLNGNTYHRQVEAFVITQDNAACAFNDNGGLDGAETLAHEFGHTLGFGHSCTGGGCVPGDLDDALMRSFIHGDGRGAALGIDDQMGAAFLYPDPNAGANLRIFQHGFENPP